MKRARQIAIAGLLIAFLYGAWGNVIAAAFCPRFSDHSCCPKHSDHSSAAATSHHQHHQSETSAAAEISGTGDCAAHQSESENVINEAASESAESIEDREDIDELPPVLARLVEDQSCTHCLNHSQPAPGRYSINSDDSNRTFDAEDVPITKLRLALPSFAKLLRSYDHGPPGQAHSLFVLNSVFRI